jgi:hypothetical protein
VAQIRTLQPSLVPAVCNLSALNKLILRHVGVYACCKREQAYTPNLLSVN